MIPPTLPNLLFFLSLILILYIYLDFRLPVRICICVLCGKFVREEDREFAEEWGAHPGILGPVCPVCYHYAVELEPALPWTDPISGFTDYGEMGRDLGVWPADDRDLEDEARELEYDEREFYEGGSPE